MTTWKVNNKIAKLAILIISIEHIWNKLIKANVTIIISLDFFTYVRGHNKY